MVRRVSRPYSVNDLSDALDEELSWRRREISFLKFAFQSAKFEERQAIGRACHVALYAHWEGFVREAGQLYLFHISFRAKSYKELRPGIFFAANPSVTGPLRSAGDNAVLATAELANLMAMQAKKFRNTKPEINTRSNLKMEILQEIDCVLGNVGISAIPEKKWLDEKLVGKRNTIAHGKSANVDFAEFEQLVDYVTIWMQGIAGQLTNCALQNAYEAV